MTSMIKCDGCGRSLNPEGVFVGWRLVYANDRPVKVSSLYNRHFCDTGSLCLQQWVDRKRHYDRLVKECGWAALTQAKIDEFHALAIGAFPVMVPE